MRLKNKIKGTERRIYNDDDAVSPVIAVILMVAITVVMAAIVSSWSAGVKAPTTPTTVGMDVQRSGTNITTTVTAIDPASAAPLTNISIAYKYYNGTAFQTNTTYGNSVDVGYTVTTDTNSTTLNQYIVTVTFKDSSKRVLYSQSA